MPAAAEPAPRSDDATLITRRNDAEREAVLEALGRAKHNRTQAARLLGISRRTLYKRLAALGIACVWGAMRLDDTQVLGRRVLVALSVALGAMTINVLTPIIAAEAQTLSPSNSRAPRRHRATLNAPPPEPF